MHSVDADTQMSPFAHSTRMAPVVNAAQMAPVANATQMPTETDATRMPTDTDLTRVAAEGVDAIDATWGDMDSSGQFESALEGRVLARVKALVDFLRRESAQYNLHSEPSVQHMQHMQHMRAFIISKLRTLHDARLDERVDSRFLAHIWILLLVCT